MVISLKGLFKSRYSILVSFIIFFIGISFLVRTALLSMSLGKSTFTPGDILAIYGKGFIYDLGVAVLINILYSLWLLIIPRRLNRSVVNRSLTYFFFCLTVFLILFSFFAEFAFWGEFESRFNFIAVDYLVYTYEVFNNINESYPLPLLIGGMALITAAVVWFFVRKGIFRASFQSQTPFRSRVVITASLLLLGLVYIVSVNNSWADKKDSRYRNELSKAGIWSFFAAFKSNELSYDNFYLQRDDKAAVQFLRQTLNGPGITFTADPNSIKRNIVSGTEPKYPNVIMITVESLSASFLKQYGNTENITPGLDSLSAKGINFTDMYATGTRTVRGMEALSLSVPPTPGSSIVRREGNANLFTVGTVFKKAGYDRSFFYGGDGYFDNMNKFFGSNGFDVTDRGRHLLPADGFTAKHNFIKDADVSFENAWGICDEDLFNAVIKDADVKHAANRKFYDFVMTTSNHRPYTFPAGKISFASGSGRAGAVRYTDYAISNFIHKMQQKPWWPNTVVIIVADHCASVAGKNEIDISKYHIPCMILNLPGTAPGTIGKMCSQIDIYPTLFHLLGWNYGSAFFGQNVLAENYTARIILGTYQKLGYMKQDSLVILGPQRSVESFIYDKTMNRQTPAKLQAPVDEAVSYYQTAYRLFKNGGMRE